MKDCDENSKISQSNYMKAQNILRRVHIQIYMIIRRGLVGKVDILSLYVRQKKLSLMNI